MFTRPKKDIDIDNLLSNVLNLQKPSLSRNERKSLGFLLKSSRPLTISFIAILLTATSVFATQKVIMPYLTKADENNKQATSELPIVFESGQEVFEAEEADATEEILTNSSPNPSQISYPTSSPASSSIPSYVPLVEQSSPSPLPTFQAIATQLKTYSIVPISVMNIGSMESHLQTIAQNAYQEFLKTSNLNQLDESNQIEILVGIYSRMLREEIEETRENITIPAEPYIDPTIEAKLDELKQAFENIQNQTVAMNIIEGRKQRAYQDWVENNLEIFSQIQNSHYASELNAILTAYGV